MRFNSGSNRFAAYRQGFSNELQELRFAGFSFLREGKYDKAIRFFEALQVLDPTSTYDLQTLGALYLQMGMKDSALRTLNQAISLNPLHEPTILNKVKTLLLLNRKQEAFALLPTLEKSVDPLIAGDATALRLAYS